MAYYGIDLGTSNCLAAKVDEGWEDGQIELKLLRMGNGEDSFPSVIHFESKNRYTVGEEAATQLLSDPESTIELVKVRLGKADNIEICANGEKFCKSPQEITSLLLKHINGITGNRISSPVVTVPAFFNQSQKNATKQAGQLVNMDPDQLIEEPTAALIYQIYKKFEQDGEKYLDSARDKNYLVFDFGGGTLDLSLINLQCDNGEVRSKPLAVGGDNDLGGNLIDFLFTELIIDELAFDYNDDPFVEELQTVYTDYLENYIYNGSLQFDGFVRSEIKEYIYFIKREAERVKKILSSKDQAAVVLSRGYKPLSFTREQFEDLVLINNSHISFKNRISSALRNLRHHHETIDAVLLVGGSSEIPYIRKLITEELRDCGLKEENIKHSVEPMNAVALGAAIQAGLRHGIEIRPFRSKSFKSVIARDILVDCGDGAKEVLISAGTEYPLIKPAHKDLIIPHSLALSVHLNLSERILQSDGSVDDLGISDYTFRLPLFYTGDHINVSMNINEAGLYTIGAVHEQTGEEVEFESQKRFSLPEKELQAKAGEIARMSET